MKILKKLFLSLQWDMIISGLALFSFILILGGGVAKLSKYLSRNDTVLTQDEIVLPEPEITKQGIEGRKKEPTIIQKTNDYLKTSLYDTPLSTPSFIGNKSMLTRYLESNASEILIQGQIQDAYLYVKTGDIDITRESVYFWIVDGTSNGGHLLASESLLPSNEVEFMYNLSHAPFVQRPYSLNKTPDFKNILRDYLNKDISYKEERAYYTGAFVSTTKLPNQIEKLEIRYLCAENTNCLITKK